MALPEIRPIPALTVDLGAALPTDGLLAAERYLAGQGPLSEVIDEAGLIIGSETGILALLLALAASKSTTLAGAENPFDGDAGTEPEPAAFARWWNDRDEAAQLEFVQNLQRAFDDAGACFVENHRGRLARLEQLEVDRLAADPLQRAVDWGAGPKPEAFDDVAGPIV